MAKIYPFKFEFLIRYKLEENALVVSYEVINKDTKNIYFSLGGHRLLRFRLPKEGITKIIHWNLLKQKMLSGITLITMVI